MDTSMYADELIKHAIKQRVSDIFILPTTDCYTIKFKTLVGLQIVENISANKGVEVINHFKFIAEMDIAEHRRPQVGSSIKETNGKNVFLRFSSVGDFLNRESMVIRLIYDMGDCHYFFPEQFEKLKQLSKKRGMIVTSGPTGSGKTTTMYQLIKQISSEKFVMTIEDPIEILEPDFLQTQINNQAGIDYLSLLKAALRHRPDILVIGEIRDAQTAKVAINAALSGHLVLTTIHAKSTYQIIDRFLGLGIKMPELENALTAISYQRLLPTVKNTFSCLLDIADATKWRKSVSEHDTNFVDWQQNIENLYHKGVIDSDVFQSFLEG